MDKIRNPISPFVGASPDETAATAYSPLPAVAVNLSLSAPNIAETATVTAVHRQRMAVADNSQEVTC